MTNKNDTSIRVGRNANRSEIKSGDISTSSKLDFTENKTSITVEGNADDAKLTSGEIEERPDVAELKAEIEQLLNNLAENPMTANETVATTVIQQQIAQNPTLKQRLVSAFIAGGVETLKAIFNHPAFSIPVETVKGFIEAE